MSRCYPFPPPGYAGKCSSHEALILSIKLQKEKEKANSNRGVGKCIPEKDRGKSKSSSDKKRDRHGRKEKRDQEDRKRDKKDKDDRKKEKKEKKREKKAEASAPPAVSCRKQGFADKLSEEAGNVLVEPQEKLQRAIAERLERSSVTEEHGQPIDSQNAPCSSDSTGNSGKRKRSMSSPSGIQSNGNIIRIRLCTSHKIDEPSTSGSKGHEFSQLPQAREDTVVSHSQVWPCVSLARPETPIKQNDLTSKALGLPCPASTSTATLQLVSAEVSGLKAKTTLPVQQKEKLSPQDKIQSFDASEKLSSHQRRTQKKESTYKRLFVDWAPPALDRTLMVDEDWLFGRKGDDKVAKRLRASDDAVDHLPCSAVLQPRVHFLADAEIYALPFTVPF